MTAADETDRAIALIHRDRQAEGAAALDQLSGWIGRYLSVPSDHCLTAITLWAAHTHATEVFYVTPRLILDSAEPESGKTRVLELLNLVCRAPMFTMNTTIAALYRRLAGQHRTLLLDETDAIFAPKAAQNHEDLRALLNAGYKKGATVDRCVPKGNEIEVVEFPAFAPAALAGIAGNMPPTITTRAVTIHMRRRAPGEHVDDFIEEDALGEAEPIRTALGEWAASVADTELRGARPVMPGGVVDRKAEVWRALLAVADAAGGNWPKMAREACRHFVVATDPGELSLGVRLLSDLRDLFGDRPAVATAEILERLKAMEEAPWADLNRGNGIDARRLARELRKYDVGRRTVRIGDATHKGYGAEDLADPWRRYLDHVGNRGNKGNAPGRDVTDVTDVTDMGREASPVTAEAPECPSCEQPAGVRNDKCSAITMHEEATAW